MGVCYLSNATADGPKWLQLEIPWRDNGATKLSYIQTQR